MWSGHGTMTTAPLYTTSEYAVALGIGVRAARKALGVCLHAAGRVRLINGRRVRACPVSALPLSVMERLTARAAVAGCQDAAEWLARCANPGQPDPSLAQWHPANVARAVRRRAALAPVLQTANASDSVAALTRAAVRSLVRLYLRALFGRLQWRRGLRAALAVAAALLLCRAFGQPSGWAALGGFEAILVDNGGSYRSRLDTVLTVLIGGALAGFLGSWVGRLLFVDAVTSRGPSLVLFASLASAAICFAFTFARVLTRPLASTSAIILVIFFSGVGSGAYHLAEAAANVLSFVAGGLGAAVLSLFLWPLDPFRPARENVAAVYALLADATAASASAHLPDRHH